MTSADQAISELLAPLSNWLSLHFDPLIERSIESALLHHTNNARSKTVSDGSAAQRSKSAFKHLITNKSMTVVETASFFDNTSSSYRRTQQDQQQRMLGSSSGGGEDFLLTSPEVVEELVSILERILSTGLQQGLTLWDVLVAALDRLPDSLDVELRATPQSTLTKEQRTALEKVPWEMRPTASHELLASSEVQSDDFAFSIFRKPGEGTDDGSNEFAAMMINSPTTASSSSNTNGMSPSSANAPLSIANVMPRHFFPSKFLRNQLALVRTFMQEQHNNEERARGMLRCSLNQKNLLATLEAIFGIEGLVDSFYNRGSVEASVFRTPGCRERLVELISPFAGPSLRVRAAAQFFRISPHELVAGTLSRADIERTIDEASAVQALLGHRAAVQTHGTNSPEYGALCLLSNTVKYAREELLRFIESTGHVMAWSVRWNLELVPPADLVLRTTATTAAQLANSTAQGGTTSGSPTSTPLDANTTTVQGEGGIVITVKRRRAQTIAPSSATPVRTGGALPDEETADPSTSTKRRRRGETTVSSPVTVGSSKPSRRRKRGDPTASSSPIPDGETPLDEEGDVSAAVTIANRSSPPPQSAVEMPPDDDESQRLNNKSERRKKRAVTVIDSSTVRGEDNHTTTSNNGNSTTASTTKSTVSGGPTTSTLMVPLETRQRAYSAAPSSVTSSGVGVVVPAAVQVKPAVEEAKQNASARVPPPPPKQQQLIDTAPPRAPQTDTEGSSPVPRSPPLNAKPQQPQTLVAASPPSNEDLREEDSIEAPKDEEEEDFTEEFDENGTETIASVNRRQKREYQQVLDFISKRDERQREINDAVDVWLVRYERAVQLEWAKLLHRFQEQEKAIMEAVDYNVNEADRR